MIVRPPAEGPAIFSFLFDLAGYVSNTGVNVTITPLGSPQYGRWSVTGPAEAGGDNLTGIEGFFFGKGNDTIAIANGVSERLGYVDGREGDDSITGSSGPDTLIGGAGNDTLAPGLGVFQVFGGSQASANPDDWLEPKNSNDLLLLDRRAFGSDYTLFFNPSSSSLGSFSGSDGPDGAFDSKARGIARVDYFGSAFNDLTEGGVRDDTMRGFDGDDILLGHNGSDLLLGGDGGDYIVGGDGNDILLGGRGIDGLYGEGGNDSIDIGEGGSKGDGGAGTDTIIGSEADDFLYGGSGSDTIHGGNGNDQLYGQDGNDTLLAGAGDDLVDPGLGVESLDGGTGTDNLIIDRSTTSKGVSFFLNGPAGSDGTTAINFEVMSYYGGSGDDTVRGHDGNDNLYGNGGNDVLEGGKGYDLLQGGDGADTLRGGSGIDSFYGGNGGDRIETGDGFKLLLYGEGGNDTIIGASGRQDADGGPGNDLINGEGGPELLLGGAGKDTLLGGGGNDTLDGGVGDDLLGGGGSEDRFIFAPNDGSDRVIDFDSNPTGGQDLMDVIAFHFAGFKAMLSAGVTITGNANTVIDFGINTIVTLVDVSPATIDKGDFVFA